MEASWIIAHQYGWDEIGLFVVPIVLALAGVRYLEKRASSDDGNDRAATEDDTR